MSQTMWLTTLLLILSLSVYTVKSDSHVIVRPTDSDTSICGKYATQCGTLSNLISNRPHIFSDSLDLELEFLSGTHVVSSSETKLQLERKRNVTFHGKNAKITCNTALAFIFIDIEILQMRDLIFDRCGGDITSNNINQLMLHNISASLFLDNVHTVQMDGVMVTLSKGYGVFTFNLHGDAHFYFCHFTNNNKKCSKSSSQDSCVGGNFALYFFNNSRATLPKGGVNVSITDSAIIGGSDLSEVSYSCEQRQKTPSSPFALRANGLAVILAQSGYTVKLHVNNTQFLNNTGYGGHPAVLVHDYSGVTNNVEIENSIFKENGTVVVSFIENGKNFEMSASSEIFTIRNCSFDSNSYIRPSGIHICVRPVNSSHTFFQTIRIVNSNFSNYLLNYYSHKEASIKITYSFPQNNNFPRTLIEIETCKFLNSDYPLLINMSDLLLTSLNSTYYYFSLVTIRHFHFQKWSHPAINMLGPLNLTDVIIPWKISSKNIGVIGISNCTFYSGIEVSNLHVVLRDCKFNNYGWRPAVHAIDSVIAVDSHNLFVQSWNHGPGESVLYLIKSILLLLPNSHILVLNTTAECGGGIYATKIEVDFSEADVGVYSICTITRSTNTGTAKIEFEKNQAWYGGNSIFGGRYVDCTYNCTKKGHCQVIPDTNRFDYQHLPEYISITPYSNDTRLYTEVSSPANRICLCENNEPTSKCETYDVSAYPGQEFNLSLIALGELNGSAAVIVISRPQSYLTLNIDNQLLFFPANCTTFNFSVHKSRFYRTTVELRVNISNETPKKYRAEERQGFMIKVSLSSCPLGLKPSHDYHTGCDCLPFFENFDIKCNTKKGFINIGVGQWIGYINETIAVTTKYPLDYLNSSKRKIDLIKPDEQCNFNRTGTLCGACQRNLSMVLGTSNCMECSSVYLLLLIPFALAGVALVVLLLKCNLTVSVGHINGIVFYANIVQVTKPLLFPNPQGKAYQIFSTFIAWLNLDFGIETCFFENMDSYSKVWLQFVFPVYLWILIALMVIFAKYFQKLARLCGNNYVPVLATLFLLSYTKLLRTVFAVLSYTFIEFENQSRITVWLIDGNVEYFKSKHAPLAMVAVVCILLYILPLTLLVLLAPCLQAMSHHKPFKWVNRLKPFLDAYQGPYSDKFRYWTGLLLILRVLFSFIDEVNYESDPSINFFCAIATITPLVVILVAKKVYRQRLANLLEFFSLLNIVVLCSVSWLIATVRYKNWEVLKSLPTYISVTVTMLSLLGIIVYQLILMFCPHCPTVLTRRDRAVDQSSDVCADNKVNMSTPTSSVVELEDCVELKEPLLDSD